MLAILTVLFLAAGFVLFSGAQNVKQYDEGYEINVVFDDPSLIKYVSLSPGVAHTGNAMVLSLSYSADSNYYARSVLFDINSGEVLATSDPGYTIIYSSVCYRPGDYLAYMETTSGGDTYLVIKDYAKGTLGRYKIADSGAYVSRADATLCTSGVYQYVIYRYKYDPVHNIGTMYISADEYYRSGSHWSLYRGNDYTIKNIRFYAFPATYNSNIITVVAVPYLSSKQNLFYDMFANDYTNSYPQTITIGDYYYGFVAEFRPIDVADVNVYLTMVGYDMSTVHVYRFRTGYAGDTKPEEIGVLPGGYQYIADDNELRAFYAYASDGTVYLVNLDTLSMTPLLSIPPTDAHFRMFSFDDNHYILMSRYFRNHSPIGRAQSYIYLFDVNLALPKSLASYFSDLPHVSSFTIRHFYRSVPSTGGEGSSSGGESSPSAVSQHRQPLYLRHKYVFEVTNPSASPLSVTPPSARFIFGLVVLVLVFYLVYRSTYNK